MRRIILGANLAMLFLAACAGRQTRWEGEVAPYKAMVVFHWLEDDELAKGSDPQLIQFGGESKPGLAGATGLEHLAVSPEQVSEQAFRDEVEAEFLQGLEEYQAFSDFVPARLATLNLAAQNEEADLIVLLNIGELAQWENAKARPLVGLGILEAVLWAGTGILSWWIPDTQYPTRSAVEVRWRRAPAPEETPRAAAKNTAAKNTAARDLLREFRFKESLPSGDYALSFWDRAKPWKSPLAYVLTVFLPPVLLPLQDDGEVDDHLVGAVLQDLKRELAQKLKGGYLGAAGAPFRFSLEYPANGSAVKDETARLRFKYLLEPGFEEHEPTRLSSLAIFVKNQSSAAYARRREYAGDSLRALNDKIGNDEPLEEEVELAPGKNLIRFAARTELGGTWITNTVAIHKE